MYTPTIGLEIHAELKTNTKMFCNSKNEPHHGEPNAHVCPVCMAHPGTLPVINKTAVMHVCKVGIALQGEIAEYTEFDRKNYFYPDIPKGYQISQYLYPLVKGGSLNGVAITRVHLEEDTARSLHDQGDGSIIDYNRAGVPLMELVTEPVIHDAKTAGNFARELQLLLRTLGVSDANMEKGEMRVEANISVSKTDTFGTKVEVKNINSFRSVEGAIEFEINRQIQALEGGEVIVQETRGWDEAKGKTFSQRKKESANDYRYFPDPDLPKINMKLTDPDFLTRLSDTMPLLAPEKRLKYENIGITREQIELIISDIDVDNFFLKSLEYVSSNPESAKLIANYLTSDLFTLRAEYSDVTKWNADTFTKLIEMVRMSEIGSRVAKDLLKDVVIDGIDPKEIASSRGLLQASTDEALLPIVMMVIEQNEGVVNEYRAGKESALQFLVGQGMKLSKGSANPKVLIELIRKQLA